MGPKSAVASSTEGSHQIPSHRAFDITRLVQYLMPSGYDSPFHSRQQTRVPPEMAIKAVHFPQMVDMGDRLAPGYRVNPNTGKREKTAPTLAYFVETVDFGVNY